MAKGGLSVWTRILMKFTETALWRLCSQWWTTCVSKVTQMKKSLWPSESSRNPWGSEFEEYIFSTGQDIGWTSVEDMDDSELVDHLSGTLRQLAVSNNAMEEIIKAFKQWQ